jgi:molybdopterin molybdotransferase
MANVQGSMPEPKRSTSSRVAALPDYADALCLALEGVSRLDRVEEVELSEGGGRVLAEPIATDRDLPPFDRAQMDGYAVRAADFAPGRSWAVVGKIAAGSAADIRVPPGTCVVIATGASLPPTLDTVIPHEWSDRGDWRGQPVHFTIQTVQHGHAVHRRGSDARKGDVLIGAGTIMRPQHIGIAAASGRATIPVRAKPRAAVIASGDELVPIDTPTSRMENHQIRNSNAPMIRELLHRMGASVAWSEHVPDERERTIQALQRAIDNCDLVITIGGVSVGERDHFPTAFDRCGVKRTLTGASIQPGRPIVVGRAFDGTVVVGLPGNPVSALACACLFAWPIIRVMLGTVSELPWREVKLAEAVKPNPHRRAFRPAILKDERLAIVPSWAGSGDLAHTEPTHGLLELPVQSESVPAGTPLRFLPWP